MKDILFIIALTLGAGLCMPLGGLLARFERIGPRWLEEEFRHFMIALGGGLLLGAVVEVLLPEGMAKLAHPTGGIALFMLGGVLFFLLERAMGLRRRESPQVLGMLVDYIPESIALGGLVVADPKLAALLAIVIGLQNIPEGFNAYRELCSQKTHTPRTVMRVMLQLSLIGPVAGVAAHLFLGSHPRLLGMVMLIASGGIMYLMFQEIAPQSRLRHRYAPALGAVLGFAITLLADAWLGDA